MYKHLSIVAAAALLAAAAPASAATAVYSLAVDGSSTGLGGGPFGSITVTENNGGLDITETLFNGFFIHDGNQNHNALAFNLTSSSAVTISALSSGFQIVNNSNVSEPPFGSFKYTIDCTSCASGANSTVNSLSFTAKAASGALTLASLSPNLYQNQSIYFTSDVVSTKSGFVGNTGNVGAIAATAAVPEPATWAMFIGGFGLVGGAMRRRQRVQAHFA